MTTNRETLADLKAIFRDGTALALSEDSSKKELKAFLNRLDAAIESDDQCFTPENTAPMREYYEFVQAWHDNLDTLPKKVAAHYTDTVRLLTYAIFQRHWDGLLLELVSDDPDVDFIDDCLDELVCKTCPNGCEETTPFVCLPRRRQVIALLHLYGRVVELMGENDVHQLLRHVHKTRAFHDELGAMCDSHFAYMRPDDELKSLIQS
jgi:hypothetical protein